MPGGARPGPGDVGAAGAGLDGVEDGLADPGPANGVDDGPASTLSLNLAGAIPLVDLVGFSSMEPTFLHNKLH